ncbi:MAG: ABC transporter substrate-binding protein, partial [Pseudomonadota bacterium]|nr:ABC transporter substrate-binding protein [Pseudomonadota bacterium]
MPSDNRPVNLGFIPLLDAAPLLLAQELGYFSALGLNVRLSREASWANIRDKLCVGTLQGAQLLAPMTLSVTLGLNRVKAPLTTSFVMNRNGNLITVSGSLYEQLRVLNREATASAHRSVLTLKQLIDQRRELGMAALTFATVYPYSCHNYLLRYWLGAGG